MPFVRGGECQNLLFSFIFSTTIKMVYRRVKQILDVINGWSLTHPIFCSFQKENTGVDFMVYIELNM